MKHAIAVESSEASKLGGISATYASQASCPDCPISDFCYGTFGRVGIHAKRLSPGTPLAIARAEAKAIDSLSGTRPLRIHVIGDARTEAAVRELSLAARRYRNKSYSCLPVILPVYTYTHAWEKIPASLWPPIVAWASCETDSQEAKAKALGYPVARVLTTEAWEEQTYLSPGHRSYFPCPAQKPGSTVTCAACRFCFFLRPLPVAFKPHGSKAKKFDQKLIQIKESQ